MSNLFFCKDFYNLQNYALTGVRVDISPGINRRNFGYQIGWAARTRRNGQSYYKFFADKNYESWVHSYVAAQEFLADLRKVLPVKQIVSKSGVYGVHTRTRAGKTFLSSVDEPKTQIRLGRGKGSIGKAEALVKLKLNDL